MFGLRDFTMVAELDGVDADGFDGVYAVDDPALAGVLDAIDTEARERADAERLFAQLLLSEESLPESTHGRRGQGQSTRLMLRTRAASDGTGVTSKVYAPAKAQAPSRKRRKARSKARSKAPKPLVGFEGRKAALAAGGTILTSARQGSMMVQVVRTAQGNREFRFPARELGL